MVAATIVSTLVNWCLLAVCVVGGLAVAGVIRLDTWRDRARKQSTPDATAEVRGSKAKPKKAKPVVKATPTPEPALSRPPARVSVRREAERRDMSSSAKHADARDVRLWVDEENAPADAMGRTRGIIGRANAPDANARTFPSLIPARAGAVTESAAHDAGGVSDSGGSDSDDDDDKRTCGEAVATAGSSVFAFVTRRFDLLVGVAGLIFWLYRSNKLRECCPSEEVEASAGELELDKVSRSATTAEPQTEMV